MCNEFMIGRALRELSASQFTGSQYVIETGITRQTLMSTVTTTFFNSVSASPSIACHLLFVISHFHRPEKLRLSEEISLIC